ncbi:MAG: type II CAAX prenyl endopeptidase Rce1 family protein, partial [Candidatus Hermodarchaeota archaeon]
ADYKESTIHGLFIVVVFLFIAIFFRLLLETVFLILGLSFQHHIPWFLTSYEVLNDPFVLLVFFILAMITSNLFVEFLYRRTLIPLLEDRGLSPFHAVILSSIGFCFLRLPDFLLFPCNFNLYSVILYITFGFCAGLIYILTRNIIYPILFHALYFFHYYIDLLGPILKNSAFIIISDLLNAVALIASIGIMIYGVWEFLDKNSTAEWISILQKRSVPKIKRGLIGFLIISISLLGLNTLVIFIGNEFITRAFPDYFVYIIGFYFIAFSIPFWLTIKTEYATY